jgi:hypothetical protein
VSGARLRLVAMDAKRRRAELKAFLQARRASLTPEAVGLPRGTRRLTPGLRREEVAALASVGATWYTWLEQGRPINISGDALERLSRALKLSASDVAYVFTLVGLPINQPPGTGISEAMRLAVAGFMAGPAFVFSPKLDVLAHNDLAERVFALSAVEGRFGNNHLWRCFMDPDRQQLYGADRAEAAARQLVGVFRLRYGEYVGEPEYEELVRALSAGSPLFVKLWGERHTQPLHTFELPLNHPTLGSLHFYSVRATPGDASANRLFFLTTAAAATAEAMRQVRTSAAADSRRTPPRAPKRRAARK